MGQEGFWEDVEAANKVNQRMKVITGKLDRYRRLESGVEDVNTLMEMAEEEADESHLRKALQNPEEFANQNRLLFRSIGKRDVFFRFFLEEDQLCSDYGFPCVRRIYEGGHDWNVWRRSACDFLQLLFWEEK